MAATFLQTNFNTQDPTTYRGAIDANFAVAAPIVDNFAPRAAATPNMTVLLDAGAISTVGGMPVQIAQQTSVVLVAPAVNPRRDIVHIDSVSGVIGIATGAEAASPVDPAIPAGKIPIARIPLATTTTTIPNSIIVDLRAPVMASGGVKFAAIVASATITPAQSGTTFRLSGTTVTVTLPTPVGNAGTRYRFIGTDANTQTLSTPIATFSAPDGTTAATWGIANNQALDIESDGSVWRIMSMEGYVLAQTPATADNSTKVATTAYVKARGDTLYQAIGSVASFNARTGAVALSSADVTNALAFTPSPNTHTHSGFVATDNGHGNVGSFVWARHDTASATLSPGTTYAGANLSPAGIVHETGFSPSTAFGGASLAGTWRCLGYAFVTGAHPFTLFQRIA